ncbi:MAG: tRNA (adenosine(37)-N6)-threonylcarbamoyltransferase complex dimerization subunit type 1 TsaB [Ruminiclostridium sp.]|nr:tRNA (adenosine(37)-N6)-threonylcarbamoyltransferase complex dimerization subunit type 1 TsaB [Ruminiclostridium sp.]
MRILAVDTSSAVAAVAIMNERELLGEFILNHKKTHSQKLIPMIDVIMKNLELSPEDIDVYAASSGPGSFTGLRIGITTIKAMAFAAKKPVVSVPALDALAYNVPNTGALVCPMMDARNNQVYTALYKFEKGMQVNISEYMGVPVQELVQIIRGKNSDVLIIGDGVLIHKEYLKSELGPRCHFPPQYLLQQRASSVAQLALNKAAEGKLENCFDMVPFYLRKSQAERELEKKRQENTPEAK